MYRVEDKYIYSEAEMAILEKKVSAILESDVNQIKEGYTVTSIYFDDLFDSHLQDTLDGYGNREKYRIRFYNHSVDVIKLEVKNKRYNRTLKYSAGITYDQMHALMRGECIEDAEPSITNPITLFNLAISSRGLRPKVIVEYDRKAYTFAPGNVRITFDRNLRRAPVPTIFGIEKMEFEYIVGFNQILEVKYDEFLPEVIAQLLETGKANQIAYSKYRLCRERTM